LKHRASPAFWQLFEQLPETTREQARRGYELLKDNPQHPSLHFKKIGRFRSIRVGRRHRALGVEIPGGILWFWIGTHAEYDRLLG